MGRDRIEILLDDEAATRDFAARFASTLPQTAILALSGDLGTGKTTFMKGLVRGLQGKDEWVQSPTFVYLHPYPTTPCVNHFDLYRLKCEEDFLSLGFDEYFDQGIMAIEWPERIRALLPNTTIWIRFFTFGKTRRKVLIE